jgi:hypothetical protein
MMNLWSSAKAAEHLLRRMIHLPVTTGVVIIATPEIHQISSKLMVLIPHSYSMILPNLIQTNPYSSIIIQT